MFSGNSLNNILFVQGLNPLKCSWNVYGTAYVAFNFLLMRRSLLKASSLTFFLVVLQMGWENEWLQNFKELLRLSYHAHCMHVSQPPRPPYRPPKREIQKIPLKKKLFLPGRFCRNGAQTEKKTRKPQKNKDKNTEKRQNQKKETDY